MDAPFALASTEALEEARLLATSLAIGLLIGLERERHADAKAGLRTFALTALLASLAALLDQRAGTVLMPLGLVLTGAMTGLAYLRKASPEADPGTTSVAAILLCYLLGAAVQYGMAPLAVALAVVATALLHFKPELRGFAQRLARGDIESVLQFCTLAFVVYPLLPDRGFGPYEALNPRQVWLMVVLISGLSLAGYVALRLTGARYGGLVTGFFGGLVSSTATTLAFSRHVARAPQSERLAAQVILMANLVVTLRLAVVSWLVAPLAARELLLPLAAGAVAGAAAMLWLRGASDGEEAVVPEVKNPTELVASLLFGAGYALVLLLSAWIADAAGAGGLYLLAAVSGLTDVDAIALSSLRMTEVGGLAPAQAALAIVIAVSANLAVKSGVALAVGGAQLLRRTGPGMAAMAIAMLAAAIA